MFLSSLALPSAESSEQQNSNMTLEFDPLAFLALDGLTCSTVLHLWQLAGFLQ